MKRIKLECGSWIDKASYIVAKTHDLKEFGYSSLTQADVRDELEKVLEGSDDLSVVGYMIKKDLHENQD